MLDLFGHYDVVVVGAGVTGVTAAISAGREGARTLLVEGTGFIGGNVTAGRLTKPTGDVDSGLFWEMMSRAADLGGADISLQDAGWGEYRGIFDPEVMLRIMLQMLEEASVEILLHAQVMDAIGSNQVKGIEVLVKSGRKIILADALIDASGDGDVAALSGAQFAVGNPDSGHVQPMSCYLRMMNVETPVLARYIRENPDEFSSVVLPPVQSDNREDYAFRLLASGFTSLIEKARADGKWAFPKNYLTVKTGLLPGEINLNITRFQGDGLDERVLSRAEVELRKQAYEAVDFCKSYLPGFERGALLDVAPKLGIRETRRITGDYILTGDDVKSGRDFADSIGFARAPLDVHEPGGQGGGIVGVEGGYGVPYRCLLPKNIEGLLIAGRCISVDDVAFGSTRNIPVCVLTGEAAGIAGALAARAKVTPRSIDVGEIQASLHRRGIKVRENADASGS